MTENKKQHLIPYTHDLHPLNEKFELLLTQLLKDSFPALLIANWKRPKHIVDLLDWARTHISDEKKEEIEGLARPREGFFAPFRFVTHHNPSKKERYVSMYRWPGYTDKHYFTEKTPQGEDKGLEGYTAEEITFFDNLPTMTKVEYFDDLCLIVSCAYDLIEVPETQGNWLKAIIKARLEQEMSTHGVPDMSIGFIDNEGHVRMGREVATLTWTSGNAKIVETLNGVVIDGNTYAEEPTDAILAPVSYDIKKESELKQAHQKTLLAQMPSAIPAMVAAEAGRGKQGLISGVGAKASLVLYAACVNRSRVKGTLYDIAKFIWDKPGTRDLISLARQLKCLDDMRFFLSDFNTAYPFFHFDFNIDNPDKAARDNKIQWGRNLEIPNAIRAAAQQNRTKKLQYQPLGSLNGEFVINLTGAMKINTADTAAFRLYVRAASMWNDVKYSPKEYTIDQLGELTNSFTLNGAAAKGDRNSIKARSKTRAKLKKSMEYLADELNLLKINKRGDLYSLAPPSAHTAAVKQIENNKAQRKIKS